MSKFSLQIEDGTIQNGSTRGDDSTDLQVARASADQVASGYASVLVGGYGNTAYGDYSAAFGELNYSSGASALCMGSNNTAGGTASLAIGFNTTAAGNYSLSGGSGSVAQADGSASIGYENATYGAASTALFSVSSLTDITAPASYVMGTNANTYLPMQKTYAGGSFTSVGDAQVSQFVAKAAMFNVAGGATETLQVGQGTTTPLFPKGNNRAWSFIIDCIMVCNDAGTGALATGDVYKVTKSGFFKVVGGTTSLSTVDSYNEQFDLGMNGAQIVLSAGPSNTFLITAIAPIAASSSDFRILANVTLSEIAW